MAKIKIVFRKQVWADINAYYPNFPAGLRKAIDNALFRLMGGEEAKTRLKPEPKQVKPRLSTTGAAEAILIRRTKRQCNSVNSKTFALLSQYAPGSEHVKDDVINRAVQQHALNRTHVLHNLLRDKYFEIVE